uniref:Uncharacterized protein n=1 Tax=Arundo donax TaxID=35708 RepID=A0A0A9E8S0_ARUDO
MSTPNSRGEMPAKVAVTIYGDVLGSGFSERPSCGSCVS